MFGYLQGVSGGPELEKLVKKMKKIYRDLTEELELMNKV